MPKSRQSHQEFGWHYPCLFLNIYNTLEFTLHQREHGLVFLNQQTMQLLPVTKITLQLNYMFKLKRNTIFFYMYPDL